MNDNARKREIMCYIAGIIPNIPAGYSDRDVTMKLIEIRSRG